MRKCFYIEDSAGESMEITIRRVEYDVDLVLQLIEDNPDYPKCTTPQQKYAYIKMFQTATHWKMHMRDASS